MKRLTVGQRRRCPRGAYEAGVTSSILISRHAQHRNHRKLSSSYAEIYVEWAPNEKVAAEVAIGSVHRRSARQ